LEAGPPTVSKQPPPGTLQSEGRKEVGPLADVT
jgi:hypothetical protein